MRRSRSRGFIRMLTGLYFAPIWVHLLIFTAGIGVMVYGIFQVFSSRDKKSRGGGVTLPKVGSAQGGDKEANGQVAMMGGGFICVVALVFMALGDRSSDEEEIIAAAETSDAALSEELSEDDTLTPASDAHASPEQPSSSAQQPRATDEQPPQNQPEAQGQPSRSRLASLPTGAGTTSTSPARPESSDTATVDTSTRFGGREHPLTKFGATSVDEIRPLDPPGVTLRIDHGEGGLQRIAAIGDEASSSFGDVTVDRSPSGGALVGMYLHQSRNQISLLQPIYHVDDAYVLGSQLSKPDRFGSSDDAVNIMLAEPGYAITGIEVGGHRSSRVRFQYGRITDGKIVAGDDYWSDWIGDEDHGFATETKKKSIGVAVGVSAQFHIHLNGLGLLVPSTPTPVIRDKMRTWTSAGGAFTVRAELLRIDGDTLHLRREDGETLAIPKTNVSDADQQFVTTQG